MSESSSPEIQIRPFSEGDRVAIGTKDISGIDVRGDVYRSGEALRQRADLIDIWTIEPNSLTTNQVCAVAADDHGHSFFVESVLADVSKRSPAGTEAMIRSKIALSELQRYQQQNYLKRYKKHIEAGKITQKHIGIAYPIFVKPPLVVDDYRVNLLQVLPENEQNIVCRYVEYDTAEIPIGNLTDGRGTQVDESTCYSADDKGNVERLGSLADLWEQYKIEPVTIYTWDGGNSDLLQKRQTAHQKLLEATHQKRIFYVRYSELSQAPEESSLKPISDLDSIR